MPSMDLPPPPLHPELPPEVQIASEEEIFFTTDDGVQIEARAYLPAGAERVAVICHPHPLYGGTMHNAIVVVVAKRIVEVGRGRMGFVRLNYRGVGESEGRYDGGKSEALDIVAAFPEARRRVPRAKISVVGYSFGSGAGYRAAVIDGNVDKVSLVAPSPRMLQGSVGEYQGPVEIVAAEHDQYCAPEETTELARRLRASVHVVQQADHFFVRFRREVAGLVVGFIAPELIS